MGLSLELSSFVVGHPHVAGIAAVVAVAHTVVAVGMWCTNCSVRLDVVDAAAAIAVVAVAIVVAIPTADDSNHLQNPVDCCFALRRIDVDPSKVVATNKRQNKLGITSRRQSIIFIRSLRNYSIYILLLV